MSDNILVGVRVRPLIAREEVDRPALHWQISDTNTITQVDPSNNKVVATPYAFDRVFGSEYGNEDVYAAVAQPIVESALTGFNGTVFAYGQTSSGKTYTMMGDKKNLGIIPLAIQNIFRTIQNTPDREYLIRVSYMEIYNENISDLIAERERRGKSLSVREDTSGSVYVADLKEECVNCEENHWVHKKCSGITGRLKDDKRFMCKRCKKMAVADDSDIEKVYLDGEAIEVVEKFCYLGDTIGAQGGAGAGVMARLLALMRKGEKNRHVGVTNMNERSSRSHSIFRMIIESRERSEEDGVEEAVTVSHLNLVDLAGSENASQSGATGDRLKEGGFINKSLFMLGRVISQLSDGERHVNYRDSKLTRILQLSLGGNARTAIICTITPAAVEQTISTLRFASRAKSIKNKAIVNEVLSEAALLKRYAKEIKDLKRNLDQERKCDKAQEVEQVREKLDEEARKNQELLAKVNELKTKLIVSSLPRGKTPLVKKNRARRETWAAPAIAQAMRTSLGPVPFGSNKMDLCFRRPELPPWTEHKNVSFGSSLSSDSPDKLNDCSITSDDFGTQDVSLVLDAAEQSKLGCLETVFESPEPSNINTKRRRRRVMFNITPSPSADTKEAACQTYDSSVPSIGFTTTSPATPKREGMFSLAGTPRTPSTPAHVLRSRNQKLTEKLIEQDEWLSNWQKEMRDLQEFQIKEIKVLEESYENKIGNYKQLDPDVEQNQSLCKSLHDAQMLLMDANRALTERSQSNERLNQELEKVKEENEHRGTCEQELITLRHQYNEIKKKYEDRESKLSQLENERNDFDMRMELTIAKQKQKEEDIRTSLEDAWQEIAAYEKSDMDEVKRRFQQNVELQKQLSDLTADADAQKRRQVY
ncbi:hypothetical protein Pcinc_003281 [Petrolisthes cinctipes]|uniref:Kinesin-like protein n=1 Tax=Petrolisthes cinctipes TaxID=88211 RepID=A0AAE1GJ67_PETCI|nr:hypothetical protein Pcinc_003281 [Petrolisthes cinctipes]